MRLIVQNLLRSTALEREQRRWRTLIGSTYLLILFVTGLNIFYIYQNNNYITRLYQRDIYKVQQDLERLKPKIAQIEKLYNERNNLKDLIAQYQQRRHRPEFWLTKLQLCASQLPNDMRLEEIRLNLNNRSGQELLILRGNMSLNSGQSDLTTLYTYQKALENDPRFMVGLSRVEILQNRIFTSGNVQTMSYSIGVFEK